MTGLALLVEPGHGEAWHSYLTRVAQHHGSNLTALVDHIGLRTQSHWPPFHGVLLAADLTDHLAGQLHLDPARITQMHLVHYDQRAFDLTGLEERAGRDRLASVRQVAHQGWVHLAGSRYCPQCLARDGYWRLEWRVPWITTCPRHCAWLQDRCPACAGIPGLYNRQHSNAPTRAAAGIANPSQCDLPTAHGACRFDLATVAPESAPLSALSLSATLRRTIHQDHGTVAGDSYTSLRTLRAWQAGVGLAIALGQIPVDRLVRNHRWGAPPRDPRLVHQLLEAAAPLLDAPSTTIAAERLRGWCRDAGITSPNRGTFDRATRHAEALQPIIDTALADVGRAHIQIARSSHQASTALSVLPWGPDEVPQLVWRCALPPQWQHASKPDQRILRAVAAMILVRMATGHDWPTTGALLGFPAQKARDWTRYCFAARFDPLKRELLKYTHQLGQILDQQPRPDHWAARPDIPPSHGTTALRTAQAPPCRHEDPTAAWCPCTGHTTRDRP